MEPKPSPAPLAATLRAARKRRAKEAEHPQPNRQLRREPEPSPLPPPRGRPRARKSQRKAVASRGASVRGVPALAAAAAAAIEAEAAAAAAARPMISDCCSVTGPAHSGARRIIGMGTGRELGTSSGRDSAVRYMVVHGSTGLELYNYIVALEDPIVLCGFSALESYEKRKNFLDSCLERGVLKGQLQAKLAKTPPGGQ